LAQQLLAALRVIDAESAAQAWLAADPANPHAHLNAGLLALLRSHEAGLALVEQAAALDAGLVPLARSLSAAVARAQLESDPAYQQLLLGREAANLGYPLIGELLCAQAVQINPAYAEAWALLGELQQRNGRGGLDALEQALALDPESTLVRSLLALYWQRRDDPAQAAAVFAQLAQEQPETALWQIEAGRATGQAGDIPAGLAQLVEASLAFPADLSVWTALAEYCALYQIELNTYGLTAAREALRLAPQDPAARSAMGAVLFSLGDLESAARYFQQVLDAQPEDTGALYRLGLIAAQQDRLDDARWYFSRVLELAPAYAELHTLAARSLEALGGS
jgi:tetratricopeptide (TPR) repeat protein